MKYIYIISGGTVNHVRPHFALAAPAYGTVGREITDRLHKMLWDDDNSQTDCAAFIEAMDGADIEPTNKYGLQVVPIFTRMAQGQNTRAGGHQAKNTLEAAGLKYVETNADVQKLVDYLKTQASTRCIVMAAAICDWEPSTITSDYYINRNNRLTTPTKKNNLTGSPVKFGKDQPRLKSRDPGGHPANVEMRLKPSNKIIGNIRAGEEGRKDIFLVSFKATAGLTPGETYAAGLKGLKGSSSNLVLANDVQTGTNVVVTPEEFPYFETTREAALDTLCEMILGRLQLTFTRTVMVPGEPAHIKDLHNKGAIPPNFLPVLEHLIKRGAYKVLPWKDSTSGHFGCVTEGEEFSRISSIRKVNHNLCLEEGVAKIMGTTDDGKIIAMGGRPSVGEHTQQQIYDRINKTGDDQSRIHSIVHFHCPMKIEGEGEIPTRPQKLYECGSDQCGTNTSRGMSPMLDIGDGIWAVHLEGHGPNIAFHRDVPAEQVIEFIERFWNLDRKSSFKS